MLTVKRLRDNLRSTGIKGIWRMRKSELMWCKLAKSCHAKLAGVVCPLTQNSPSQPFIADGVVFERLELRKFIEDHALHVVNPITRVPLDPGTLSSLHLDSDDVESRCKQRFLHEREVECACQAYDIVSMEFCDLIRTLEMTVQDDSLTARLLTIQQDLPVVDCVLKSLCETSWRQKRHQLKTMVGGATDDARIVYTLDEDEPEEIVD